MADPVEKIGRSGRQFGRKVSAGPEDRAKAPVPQHGSHEVQCLEIGGGRIDDYYRAGLRVSQLLGVHDDRELRPSHRQAMNELREARVVGSIHQDQHAVREIEQLLDSAGPVLAGAGSHVAYSRSCPLSSRACG
ncbi:MAG: hypothetical protein HYY06_13505 [Deltaproteobacteria bacterium]|nr:hypothetical protein [Deltaproteobacteria bacterium]